MDLIKLLSVLFVLYVGVDAGGHGEKHHDHVNLHVPEFIHHDHHTKVITIHHHHHKPKKEQHHHHHHHHHPQPHIPHGHHYHHKKTATHSVSKGHSTHHGHHGHHKHQGHHGNHGHHHGHHDHEHHDTPISYDPPSVSYDQPSISYKPPEVNYSPGSSFESDFAAFVPSVPHIPSTQHVPSTPHVHGVVHTVKQVKVFDSLPGALPGSTGSIGNTGSHGYEVTEQGEEEGEDDIFTAVNTLSQTYPGTYGFVRNAAPEVNHDPFAEIAQQATAQTPNHDPFASVAQPTSYANIEGGTGPSDAFEGLPVQGNIIPNIQSPQFSGHIPGTTGFNDAENIIIGDVSGPALLSGPEGYNNDSPVSFSREAGIQQTIKTGGVESVAY